MESQSKPTEAQHFVFPMVFTSTTQTSGNTALLKLVAI